MPTQARGLPDNTDGVRMWAVGAVGLSEANGMGWRRRVENEDTNIRPNYSTEPSDDEVLAYGGVVIVSQLVG